MNSYDNHDALRAAIRAALNRADLDPTDEDLAAAAAKGYHKMQPDEMTEGIRRNRDLILRFTGVFR